MLSSLDWEWLALMGVGAKKSWENLIDGNSGASRIEDPKFPAYPVKWPVMSRKRRMVCSVKSLAKVNRKE